MGHVFICHVTEDSRQVKELRDALASYDVAVWNPDSIPPGVEYLPVLRHAIHESTLFILCLSRSFLARMRTVAFEELTAAVEEWRMRPAGRAWLVPLLLEPCEVPDVSLGRGISLRNLQWLSLSRDWEGTLIKLFTALQPDTQSSSPRGMRATMRYRVGQAEARVLVDLLGGGDETFDRRSIQFEYLHEWVPLSPLISERRDRWIEEEKEDAQRRAKELFNGPCVRLHSFRLNIDQSDDGDERKRPTLILRPTCWFDYVVSNKRLDQALLIAPSQLTTLRAECADEGRLCSTRETAWIALSNILTVSVVLLTTDRWTVVGRRTNRVDNARGVLQASAAENVHRWKDEPSVCNREDR